MEEKRGEFIGLKMSLTERRMLEALAQRMERSLSDAVRYVVRQAARELLAPAQSEKTGGEQCSELL